jgi:hypothetical protein
MILARLGLARKFLLPFWIPFVLGSSDPNNAQKNLDAIVSLEKSLYGVIKYHSGAGGDPENRGPCLADKSSMPDKSPGRYQKAFQTNFFIRRWIC